MEIKPSPVRAVLLILLVAYFWYMEGFTRPDFISHGVQEGPAAEAWLRCVLMYLGVAVAATVIDHHVGTLDRTNLRPVYIVAGIALMTGSLLWLRILKHTVSAS